MTDFLHKSFELAAQVDPHKTAPNPRVGCVIVHKNKIISQGVHEKYGSNHAEKNAFENLEIFFKQEKISQSSCQDILKNIEVYITLEPCDDFKAKKTPSCSNLLLKYQPKKITVGQIDPHFNGKNIQKLKNLGLNIEIQENNFCNKLNPFFKKNMLEGRPYICLKVAQSLNGKITNRKNKNQYLTSQKSLEAVHFMRSQYSTILTSTETVLQDNPSFNIRLLPSDPQRNKGLKVISNPDIIILGKRKIPENYNIFKIKDRKLYFLESLDDLEKFCKKEKIDSIMTECGGTLNTQLLEKNLVDEIKIFIAPLFLDENEVPSFTSVLNLKNFKIKKVGKSENDISITYQKK